MFITGCEVPTRSTHLIGSDVTMLVMPAWQVGRYAGVKIVNVAPGNAARGLPGLFSTYVLHDATTGEPLALIDGNVITSRRTAAASALAASLLADPAARTHLVIGAGRVGRLLPEAYRCVLPIEEFLVWDVDSRAAGELAATLRDAGHRASVVANLAEAARRADIVSCATLATSPLVFGGCLSPGSHLDLIGSFAPDMREASADCFAGANVWIDTPEALLKSGDLLEAVREGAFSPADVRGTLTELCEPSVHRHAPGTRTVFKSVGTALEDLAAAILVYEAA